MTFLDLNEAGVPTNAPSEPHGLLASIQPEIKK